MQQIGNGAFYWYTGDIKANFNQLSKVCCSENMLNPSLLLLLPSHLIGAEWVPQNSNSVVKQSVSFNRCVSVNKLGSSNKSLPVELKPRGERTISQHILNALQKSVRRVGGVWGSHPATPVARRKSTRFTITFRLG